MRLGYQRGDTIVEVLLAIAVFSMVAVGTLVLMSQGVSTAQRSLEVTLVKQQIDAQAEALRAVHHGLEASPNSQSRAAWNALIASAGASSPEFEDGQCPTSSAGFIMNPRTAEKHSAAPRLDMNSEGAPPYAQVVFENEDSLVAQGAYGIWIEVDRHNGSGGFRDAFDFRIRACWYGPGQSTPMTLDTNVRLYEP